MTAAAAVSSDPIVSLRGATFGYADNAVVRPRHPRCLPR